MSQCPECQKKQIQINRLHKKLLTIQVACNQIVNEANEVMRSHVPRGKWSYAKGRKQAAGVIKSLLSNF